MQLTLRRGVLVWLLMLACWASFRPASFFAQPGRVFAEDISQKTTPVYTNTLRWTTASEVDNFGFDVYRSRSPDGPFVRMTKSPIPGAGTRDEPSHYSYADDTIQPDVEYYYYIESISMAGEREKFTPTYKAPMKSATP